VEDAANLCNMSFSTGRWLNGLLTASLLEKKTISPLTGKKRWNKTLLAKYKHIKDFTTQTQTFALIVLPDAPHNKMIWREAKKKNIPTLGLLSSMGHLDLHYAILGDYTSTYVVSFFAI